MPRPLVSALQGAQQAGEGYTQDQAQLQAIAALTPQVVQAALHLPSTFLPLLDSQVRTLMLSRGVTTLD